MSVLVVDPNVFVSAFISPRRAAPGALIEAFLDGRVEVLACPLLLEELGDVLARPKFTRQSGDGRGVAFVATVADRVASVPDPTAIPRATDDRDDDYLVALAREHDVEAIVSGDAHLLDAASIGVAVWTPRTALGRLGLIA